MFLTLTVFSMVSKHHFPVTFFYKIILQGETKVMENKVLKWYDFISGDFLFQGLFSQDLFSANKLGLDFRKLFFSENVFGDKFQKIQYKTVLLIGNFLLFSSDPNLKASHELSRIKTRKISLFFFLEKI